MPSNRVTAANDSEKPIRISMEYNIRPTWEDLVDREAQKNLISVTCHAYSVHDEHSVDQTKVCLCGRLARCHSFDDVAKRQEPNVTFGRKYLSRQKLIVYGQLHNGSKVRNIFITIQVTILYCETRPKKNVLV
jgi:hypothetical protein